jgi:hypothetical protein
VKTHVKKRKWHQTAVTEQHTSVNARQTVDAIEQAKQENLIASNAGASNQSRAQ